MEAEDAQLDLISGEVEAHELETSSCACLISSIHKLKEKQGYVHTAHRAKAKMACTESIDMY
eukprot:scaffold6868_cov146-Skeletonema_dohrnii-CCMP3373.AAC.9